ncbi:efflux RND transporter periplasmic adaptor subunit [Marinoscillum pacificum]|uniref:efflux RND transporter periplasmic adaptor subunit n=1 Tax=Marinoscillum pacificum TaxID=392723 RepID=UPI00215807CD|nr:efflux RND transporter periplasmic adaptor subunit [Marinoscillum pacificum]
MKKYIISAVVIVLLMVATTIKLIGNKRELDEAKVPVDRTKIPVAVKVATVEKSKLSIAVNYPAVVQPIEDARVFTQASGMVEQLYIELGTRVKEGQVIGQLDADMLRINLRDAQLAFGKSLDDYNRVKDLYDHNAASKVDMLNAKYSHDKIDNQIRLLEKQIENTSIKAPISGVVHAKMVKEGEFVNPGTPIAFISNVFTLKATVYVNQELVYQLTEGDLAKITTPILPEKVFEGKIEFISPVADAHHNYQVDLLLETSDHRLRGGSDVQVSFQTYSAEEVLQIPMSALVTDAEEPYVFLVEGGTVVMRTVETGLVKGDDVEIIKGLSEGDHIVTTGQINLREGSIVNIID